LGYADATFPGWPVPGPGRRGCTLASRSFEQTAGDGEDGRALKARPGCGSILLACLERAGELGRDAVGRIGDGDIGERELAREGDESEQAVKLEPEQSAAFVLVPVEAIELIFVHVQQPADNKTRTT
jgi:hypothetical protein